MREKIQSNKLNPSGVGGWLIIYVIGLIAGPFVLIYTLQEYLIPLFTEGTWSQLTTQGNESYHILWAPLIIFEMVGNIGSILLCVYNLWLILKKSHLAPKISIATTGASAALSIADHFAIQLIPGVADCFSAEEINLLVISLAGATVWIPYFLISKRVKNTFPTKA